MKLKQYLMIKRATSFSALDNIPNNSWMRHKMDEDEWAGTPMGNTVTGPPPAWVTSMESTIPGAAEYKKQLETPKNNVRDLVNRPTMTPKTPEFFDWRTDLENRAQILREKDRYAAEQEAKLKAKKLNPLLWGLGGAALGGGGAALMSMGDKQSIPYNTMAASTLGLLGGLGAHAYNKFIDKYRKTPMEALYDNTLGRLIR